MLFLEKQLLLFCLQYVICSNVFYNQFQYIITKILLVEIAFNYVVQADVQATYYKSEIEWIDITIKTRALVNFKEIISVVVILYNES